ncbi:sugar phosphate isomerase/epimerase family protein [Paenibacillus contaminans]|uniref:sugar phosphate isomerase/epimerase family protein n=1 Tax=Paenibacillus contaminans TaxID=450362 RepID=UPI001EDDCFFF|nr:sugar phosphate isomerase/epimerase family protein [Paenibacillus contaminans]
MTMKNKIGVIEDNFKIGAWEGVKKAKEVGAEGIQLFARRELDPEVLGTADRKELKQLIDSLGLEVASLCGDTGGPRFMEIATHRERIDKTKRILDMAAELGTPIVTAHIGTIPDDTSSELYEALQNVCAEIGRHAASMKAFYAIETGPETAVHLKTFLDSINAPGLAVNFDPANLWMVKGDDPVQGVFVLQKYIVHTHVKDGVRIPRTVNGETEYDHAETPIGEGEVRFDDYFAALRQIGYTGYLTIEREKGEVPERELNIRNAIAFIKRYRA